MDDEVGRRIQDWAVEHFEGEIHAGVDEFAADWGIGDGELGILDVWLHNHRQLPGGGTLAERYASRTDLDDAERATATRIASAKLGVFRVLAVTPGLRLTMMGLDGGEDLEVRSPLVSRHVVPSDFLLAHVMEGEPLTLWGPTRTFKPFEEPALRAELERLSGATPSQRALALLRFAPPRRDSVLNVFTLEGDPVELGTAAWRMRSARAVRKRLRDLGALGDEIEITVDRETLMFEHTQPPAGAIFYEESLLEGVDRIPVASVRIDGRDLFVEAHSESRLEFAAEIVEDELGDLIELVDWDVIQIDEALEALREAGAPAADVAVFRESLGLPGELAA